jgi:hypothetical protein
MIWVAVTALACHNAYLLRKIHQSNLRIDTTWDAWRSDIPLLRRRVARLIRKEG